MNVVKEINVFTNYAENFNFDRVYTIIRTYKSFAVLYIEFIMYVIYHNTHTQNKINDAMMVEQSKRYTLGWLLRRYSSHAI